MIQKNKAASEVRDDVWIPTMCSLCYANCPIRVHKVNGVVVSIEGEPRSPATKGGICAKGKSGIQVLYDPNRLNYPVKRTNPEKGIGVDPKWQRISWDEALDTIAEKLRECYKTNPKQFFGQLTPVAGAGSHIVTNFAHAFGGSQQSGGGGTYCGNTTHLLCGVIHGAWSFTADFEHCNYALYFGGSKGHAAGHSALEMMRKAAEAKARGMKMVAFDPIALFAGGKATEWIPIIPGTDGAVALAMINVILNEIGIFDVEHIKTRSNGPFLIGPDKHYVRDKDSGKPLVWDAQEGKAKPFDDPNIKDYVIEGKYQVNGVECQPAFQLLKEHVKKYTPEMASEITTIPPQTIRRIATEFAQAASIGSTITIQGKTLPFRPVAAILFRGTNGHKNSFNTIGAIYLLNEIMGANDVPGGAIGWPTRSEGFPETGHPKWAPSADEEGFLISGWWWGPSHRPTRKGEPSLPCTTPQLSELFPWVTTPPFPYAADREEWWQRTGVSTKTKVLMNWGANQMMSHPNPDSVASHLKAIPFVFSFRLYLDEFSDFCDIVLPDTCYLEWLYPLCLYPGFNGPTGMTDWYYGIQQPVVEPMFERRSAIEVVLELCRRVDPKLLESMYTVENRELHIRAPYLLEPDASKEYSWEEISERVLKSHFGEERGLSWFKEHGGIGWQKRVEEAFFRYFEKNLRIPIYYEWVLSWGEKVRRVAEPAGIELDWRHYTPLPEYFPCPPHEVKDPDYDLYAITARDILHQGSSSLEIPWLDEASEMNPYTHTIQIHEEVGKRKGLKDGDVIWVESSQGSDRKTKAVVKLMPGIHPQVIGMSACAGHWSPNLPIARGKGPHFNDLVVSKRENYDPVSFSLEVCAKVKVYKEKRS